MNPDGVTSPLQNSCSTVLPGMTKTMQKDQKPSSPNLQYFEALCHSLQHRSILGVHETGRESPTKHLPIFLAPNTRTPQHEARSLSFLHPAGGVFPLLASLLRPLLRDFFHGLAHRLVVEATPHEGPLRLRRRHDDRAASSDVEANQDGQKSRWIHPKVIYICNSNNNTNILQFCLTYIYRYVIGLGML